MRDAIRTSFMCEFGVGYGTPIIWLSIILSVSAGFNFLTYF